MKVNNSHQLVEAKNVIFCHIEHYMVLDKRRRNLGLNFYYSTLLITYFK